MRLQEMADYSVKSSSRDGLKSLLEVVMNPSGKWEWISTRSIKAKPTEGNEP